MSSISFLWKKSFLLSVSSFSSLYLYFRNKSFPLSFYYHSFSSHSSIFLYLPLSLSLFVYSLAKVSSTKFRAGRKYFLINLSNSRTLTKPHTFSIFLSFSLSIFFKLFPLRTTLLQVKLVQLFSSRTLFSGYKSQTTCHWQLVSLCTSSNTIHQNYNGKQ